MYKQHFRRAHYKASTHPAALTVVINDLQPFTDYTLVLEADLGSGVLATSEEVKFSTTNDSTGKLVSPVSGLREPIET